jgi:RimJ/RimL family protein N-acetyltransferase
VTGVASHRFESAPTLETERLILREFCRSDLDAQHAIVGDEEVMRPVGIGGQSREDAWRRAAAAVGMWRLMGFGGWVVVRKSDDKQVGLVSLFTAWRDLQPTFGDQPEMGWIFATEVHGQGIAGEACRAALDWADGNLQPTPIWAIISPGNDPSLKLAERLGFERQAETPYQGEPIVVLRRDASRLSSLRA